MNNQELKCDILVVGAGLAGCSAAISAACRGASVILIESKARIGGVYCTANLQQICGLYDWDGKLITDSKIVNGLLSYLSNPAPYKQGRMWTLPCAADQIEGFFLRELNNNNNLTYLPETPLISVEQHDDGVAYISKTSHANISSRTIIEASGCGVVIGQLPESAAYPQERQLAGLSFTLANCDDDPLLSYQAVCKLNELVNNNEIPNYWRFVTLRKTASVGCIKGLFNVPVNGEVANYQQELEILVRHLRRSVHSLRSCVIMDIADDICSRDGLVIKGRKTLLIDNIISGTKFTDAVIQSVWPCEFWSEDSGQQLLYPTIRDYYTLPDDCLRSKLYDNLFACGKCVSSDYLSAAALRVGGIAMESGERAGLLAFLQCSA